MNSRQLRVHSQHTDCHPRPQVYLDSNMDSRGSQRNLALYYWPYTCHITRHRPNLEALVIGTGWGWGRGLCVLLRCLLGNKCLKYMQVVRPSFVVIIPRTERTLTPPLTPTLQLPFVPQKTLSFSTTNDHTNVRARRFYSMCYLATHQHHSQLITCSTGKNTRSIRSMYITNAERAINLH